MSRYQNITDYHLRSEVARFARILQKMEEKGEVLDRTADILTLLGELRQMVFAWEIRATWGEEEPDPELPPPGDQGYLESSDEQPPAPED